MTPPISRFHETAIEVLSAALDRWTEHKGIGMLPLRQATERIAMPEGPPRELRPDASFQFDGNRPDEPPDLSVEAERTHEVEWEIYRQAPKREIWVLDVNLVWTPKPHAVPLEASRPLRAYIWDKASGDYIERDDRRSGLFPELDLNLVAQAISGVRGSSSPQRDVRKAMDRLMDMQEIGPRSTSGRRLAPPVPDPSDDVEPDW